MGTTTENTGRVCDCVSIQTAMIWRHWVNPGLTPCPPVIAGSTSAGGGSSLDETGVRNLLQSWRPAAVKARVRLHEYRDGDLAVFRGPHPPGDYVWPIATGRLRLA
jgi:hypothetical protein